MDNIGVVLKDFGIVGKSDSFKKCIDIAYKIRNTTVPVLITGETGTGKEVVARFIHNSGKRKNFITLNCSAVPDKLFESEVFGYEKNAFTGALQSKPGLFELADNGTLLFDEVSELPLQSQAKLLRVLQTGLVNRLGSLKPTKVNVRIISSSNRDMNFFLDKKRFRQDLFYRLGVVKIKLPPLRQRRDDIPLLSEYFLKKISQTDNVSLKSISDKAMKLLMDYRFPGNVRELETIIRTAFIFSETNIIQVADLEEIIKPFNSQTALFADIKAAIQSGLTLRDFEKLIITGALELAGGSKKKAAKMIGITRRTIYNKLPINPKQ